MKQKFIDAYMDVAERFAKLSHAKRLNVGAIVVCLLYTSDAADE